nr:granzyme H-like [Equus caballus]XP_023479017.1 granzyme H-like [Equus caballus]XP_023479018.1 granzyme H-like [Equus caballus]XP_023479028.1 granzyme H-like [Equus caballus]
MANLTDSVSPLRLPRRRELAKSGTVCSVADWEHLGGSTPFAIKLWEVELDIQRDEQRISHYKDHYNSVTQICVGDPTKSKTLFKLERQAKQTTAVRPLSLPRGKAQVNPRQVCSVAGWGKVSPADRVSDTLQDVELTVQKDHDCYSHFTHHYNQAPQICVGDPKMMNNSFKGDSRGPLICNKLIQGIFSYGQNNRTPPGVFMKVSHFLPWIKSTMKCF